MSPPRRSPTLSLDALLPFGVLDGGVHGKDHAQEQRQPGLPASARRVPVAQGRDRAGEPVSSAHVIVWLLNQDRFSITSDCTDFRRTVPVLPTDPNKVEDMDTRTENHRWDEIHCSVTARVTLSKRDLAHTAGGKHVRRRPVLVDVLLAGPRPETRGPLRAAVASARAPQRGRNLPHLQATRPSRPGRLKHDPP